MWILNIFLRCRKIYRHQNYVRKFTFDDKVEDEDWQREQTA